MTAATTAVLPSPSPAAALFKAALKGGAFAALANLALYATARLTGVDFVARYDPHAAPQALLPLMPVVASLVPALFAALIMLGLTRVTAKARTIFAVLAGAFALVSLGGPLHLEDASLATRVVLSAMHFVAAAFITVPLVQRGGGGDNR